MEAVAAAEASSVVAAAKRRARTACESAIVTIAWTPVVTTAVVSAASVVGATAIVAATVVCPGAAIVAAAIVAVEPGAGADEEAVHEPIGAIVAVGSASIGIGVVVAVRADGSGAVNRTADAYRDAHLGVRAGAKNEKQ
jgi:hypothetical protein